MLLVSMVPIGLLAAALLYLHWRVQEHERERSWIESVRLLAADLGPGMKRRSEFRA